MAHGILIPMTVQPTPPARACPVYPGAGGAETVEVLRRRVAHHLYGRFAFASFVIWTLGTLILFITFAAGNARPIFPTMISMTLPLAPAALIWVAYRPMVRLQVARRLRAASSAGPS
jgi:hypothetical protein